MKWFLNLFFLLFFSVQSFANDYIDVNFTNLKLDEFIKIVSKVSNKNILVSEPLDINLNFVSNKKIKKDDTGSLEKFESLIFSSILAHSDKIPGTFDGLESLTSLIKEWKSK